MDMRYALKSVFGVILCYIMSPATLSSICGFFLIIIIISCSSRNNSSSGRSAIHGHEHHGEGSGSHH